MIYEISTAILQIFGIFFVGWLARHKNYIHENELNRWSSFVIDFLFPLFIFNNIANEFEAHRLAELWPLPVIGFAIMAFGAVAGFFLKKFLKSKSDGLIKTFHHFCAVNNYGFLPIIIIMNLWGDKALARLLFLNLGSSLGYWTIGVALLGESDIKKAVKKIFTPCLAALFIALIIALTGMNTYIPEVIFKITKSAGAAAIPCMLILVGATLYPLPSMTDKRDLAYLCLVRLIVLPAIMIGVLYCLPISQDVKNIAVIVALMPTSVSSTVLTRKYGGDPDFAARAAVITTIIAIVTVSLSLWLLEGVMIDSASVIKP
ncbi:MAG: AEC family transporter [Planctomycetota bacterium]|jgi:predicted permease